jgi:hypothetical protein
MDIRQRERKIILQIMGLAAFAASLKHIKATTILQPKLGKGP